MIRIYTQEEQGSAWLERYRGRSPVFACILGFTATGLIPGISAAGTTPESRQCTCIADAEFLYNGPQPQPKYPLPPLSAGVSPVVISRAMVAAHAIPVYLFNAGLPQPPSVPAIDLGGAPARCLTRENALALATVKHLLEQGVIWGQRLATTVSDGYLILSECVVGGTTTALSVLTGLGYSAAGKVNSSHPKCNHDQKWAVVQAGLHRAGIIDFEMGMVGEKSPNHLKFERTKSGPVWERINLPQNPKLIDPLHLIAAVGDPMQVVVAGMAIAASQMCGVLLAGGTQMLAVYALMQAIAKCVRQAPKAGAQMPETIGASTSAYQFVPEWKPEQVVVGTTRWVAQDSTGDTVGLAKAIGSVPLLATELSFATSRYAQLRAYEQGYVKEGVGAGGAAIAAHLYRDWNQIQLLQAIEALIAIC